MKKGTQVKQKVSNAERAKIYAQHPTPANKNKPLPKGALVIVKKGKPVGKGSK